MKTKMRLKKKLKKKMKKKMKIKLKKKFKRNFLNNFLTKKLKLLFFLILLYLCFNIFLFKFPNKQPSFSDVINDEFSGLIHRYEYLLNNKKNVSDDCPIWVM